MMCDAPLALALFASGRYPAAVAEYEKLMRSDPGDAGLRLDLGIALGKTSSLDLAGKQLEEAPSESGAAQPHYQLGLVWLAQKDFTRATDEFHQAR
jgi:Flp pilus assembly protein TadD